MEPEVFINPLGFLRALSATGIPYLLVGRQALVLLGAPLVTADYDFYLSPDRKHLDTLLGLASRRSLEVSVKNPERKPFFSLLGDTLKLDFFRARSYSTQGGGSFTFGEIFARRHEIKLKNFSVPVPSIEDLIRTKRARSSPKDKEDIKYLQVLLERQGH